MKHVIWIITAALALSSAAVLGQIRDLGNDRYQADGILVNIVPMGSDNWQLFVQTPNGEQMGVFTDGPYEAWLAPGGLKKARLTLSEFRKGDTVRAIGKPRFGAPSQHILIALYLNHHGGSDEQNLIGKWMQRNATNPSTRTFNADGIMVDSNGTKAKYSFAGPGRLKLDYGDGDVQEVSYEINGRDLRIHGPGTEFSLYTKAGSLPTTGQAVSFEEAKGVADKYWLSHFSRCNGVWASRWIGRVTVFEGASFTVAVLPLSDVDRQDGYQWTGTATMMHGRRRQYINGAWNIDAGSGRYPMSFSKRSGEWQITGFSTDAEFKPVSCAAIPK